MLTSAAVSAQFSVFNWFDVRRVNINFHYTELANYAHHFTKNSHKAE